MRVLHDLFPAFITVVPPNVVDDFKSVAVKSSDLPTGARYLERVRIVVTSDDKGDIVMVAADHHTGPRLIFSERLADLNWSGNKTDD
jgi:hypothetical protein